MNATKPLPREWSVLIKDDIIPSLGIVCSKPSRTRLVQSILFTNPEHYEFDWGVEVYVGHIGSQKIPMFVAAVPMGDSGSFHAFRELFSHGAKVVIRLGSSDYLVEKISDLDANHVTIVKQADNLISVMKDGGFPEDEIGSTLYASPELLQLATTLADIRGVETSLAVCHNTANYHATNFPSLERYQTQVEERWNQLLKRENVLTHTSDMETASLYLAARESGNHALTILQKIRKTGATREPKDVVEAQLKQVFIPLVVECLLQAENKKLSSKL